MKAHERSIGRMAAKSSAGGVGTMEHDPLAQPGGEPDGDEQDPHSVVEEHGPAMETHTEHPQDGEGEHMAHSMHPDGHEHHSSHPDGKSAHEHAMCLSGHCEHGEDKMGNQDEAEPEYE